MHIEPIPLTLRDGRTAILRSPTASDAPAFNCLCHTCARETEFLLMEAGDPDMSLAERSRLLSQAAESAHIYMLVCQLEGRIVGMCRFSTNPRRKICHRGEIIIFLASAIWGQGVGSAMFRAMFDAARAKGLTQLELGFVDGNDRARALYEKMGFTLYGRLPNAFRLLDGTFRDECLMIKKL